MADQFHFLIGGAAGEGIMVTGLIFSKFASRSGYFTFDFVEYPSLIRGGHNAYYGTISPEEVFSTHSQIDLLIALNQETVDRHRQELNPGAGIIFDPDKFSQELKGDLRPYLVPLLKLAEQAGNQLMANSVALGAMVYLVSGNLEILNSILRDTFKDKKAEVIEGNLQAAKLGYDFSQEKFPAWGKILEPRKKETKLLIAGNEALALGAIAAGLKLAAIYPMTPINSLLTFLASYEREAGIILRQPEDEIAGINLAVGAAFAGVRSLVATSGGGFALMNEALSLAGITETPLVVIFGQRSGPATGLPTCTGQEDLLYTCLAAHGEYPRIIFAPGDARECFYLTGQAFNLAEIFQTPVIILVDKLVCESHQTVVPFDLEEIKIQRGKVAIPESPVPGPQSIFPRYQVTVDGLSARVFPSKGVIVKSESDEHNEFGLAEESAENRKAQVEKRMRKLLGLIPRIPAPKLYGPEEADLTLIGWGSVKGPVLEALKKLQITNYKLQINFLHLNWLSPFPSQEVAKILSSAKKTLLIENNYQGQLGQWIRMQTGIEIKNKFLKYDGRQFYPEEIIEEIKQII